MFRLLMLLLALTALAACSDDETPEAQIRQLIASAETVIETGNLLDARSLLSDAYSDEQKRNKQVLLRLLGGYFLRNQSIHLLVQIERIDLHDPQRPRVTLYVAMAGKPLANVETLLTLHAALYRFDLELIREQQEWLFVSGHWQPATREDFLGIERQ